MRKQKVFIFTSVHSWYDTRIFRKEACSLATRYDVEFHAPASFKFKEAGGVRIVGLPEWKSVRDRKKIRKILKRRLRVSDADIFHFHDPELIPLGLWIKFLKRKPVIYDIHEDYHSYIKSKEWIPKLLRLPIASAFYFFEKVTTVFFDTLITATPSISSLFRRRNNVYLISNYPKLESHSVFPVKETDKIKFLYVGSMEEIRGIYNMARAFELFIKDNPREQVELHIAGKLIGNKNYQRSLQALFKLPEIYFHDFLPFNQVKKMMDNCHIGIIPFLPTPNHLYALPNKLFEYMAAGMVLLTSDFSLWRSIVLKEEIGWTFNPMKIRSIKESYHQAIESVKDLEVYGETSFNLVHQRYNWETEENKLTNIYQGLLKINE